MLKLCLLKYGASIVRGQSSTLSAFQPNDEDKELSAVRKKISAFQHENEEMAAAVERLLSVRNYERRFLKRVPLYLCKGT